MHAVVKTENGKFRVLQVGLRNILTPVEGTVLVPVEDPRDIRPVVVVEDGVVTETYTEKARVGNPWPRQYPAPRQGTQVA